MDTKSNYKKKLALIKKEIDRLNTKKESIDIKIKSLETFLHWHKIYRVSKSENLEFELLYRKINDDYFLFHIVDLEKMFKTLLNNRSATYTLFEERVATNFITNNTSEQIVTSYAFEFLVFILFKIYNSQMNMRSKIDFQVVFNLWKFFVAKKKTYFELSCEFINWFNKMEKEFNNYVEEFFDVSEY